MKLTNSKIFLFCCLANILGIAIASFLPTALLQNDLLYFVFLVISLFLLIVFWEKEKIRLIFFVSLFLFLGIWRYAIFLPTVSPDEIAFYNDKKVSLSGRVAEEVIYKAGKQKIYLETEELSGRKIGGLLLVVTEAYPIYEYGDILKIDCNLQTPEKIEDFSYDRYLARYGIYSVCYYPKIEKMATGQGNYFFGKILKIKNGIRQTIISGSREPYAGLIQATILGGNESISADLQQIFAHAGISHLIAISGMHISLLAAILLLLLINIGFNRRQAFYLLLLLIWLYVAMIGFMPSAARAAVMSSLFLWAMYLGRLSKAPNVLCLAAFILLLFNPLLLRDDLGFQLSFLALLGMGTLFPLGQNWVEKKNIPQLAGLRDGLILTLAAQVFTMPLIAYSFSQISLVAPLTNLLTLWTAPFLLIFSVGAIFLSWLFPGLAMFWFFPAEILFWYMIKISELVLLIPYASIIF